MIFSIILYLYFCVAAYGFGVLACKRIGLNLPIGLEPIVGLGVVLWIGGVLNLVGAAYPASILILALVGFSLGSWHIWSCRESLLLWLKESDWKELLLYCLVPAVLSIYFIATGTETEIFNWHDDLEKYLKFPNRMLATGSVASGFFDAMGSETFGGMAFLQAFAYFPWGVGYVNAVDSVFGYLLCIGALVSVCRYWGGTWWVAALSTISFSVVNNMYVNTSAIFLGSGFYILLFVFPLCWKKDDLSSWRSAFILSLGYSSLAALKITLAVYAPIHLLIYLLSSFTIFPSWRRSISFVCKVGALTALLWGPWLGVHSDKVIALLSEGNMNQVDLTSFVNPGRIDEPDLLSREPIFYGFGSSLFNYTILGLCLLVLGGCQFWFEGRCRKVLTFALLCH